MGLSAVEKERSNNNTVIIANIIAAGGIESGFGLRWKPTRGKDGQEQKTENLKSEEGTWHFGYATEGRHVPEVESEIV